MTRSRWKHAFKMLGIIFVLLFIGEGLARFYTYIARPQQSYFKVFDAKQLIALNVQPISHPFIVLMGDSLMNRGVSPEWLQQRLREGGYPAAKVVNLSVNAGTPHINLRLLEYLMHNNTPPDLLLYNYEPANMGIRLNLSAAQKMKYDLDKSYLYRCRMNLPVPQQDALDCFMGDHFYLYRNRGVFKKQVFDFLNAVFHPSVFDADSRVNVADSSDDGISRMGWGPVHATFNWDGYRVNLKHNIEQLYGEGPQKPGYAYSWSIYAPLMDYAHARHIPTSLVWLPIYDWFYEQYFYKPPYTRDWFFHKFQTVGESYPGILPINLNRMDLDHGAYFDDVRHLNIFGAIKVTDALADYLLKDSAYKALLSKAQQPHAAGK